MKRCLSELGCELCTCVFTNGELDVNKYAGHMNYLETLYWILNYTSLERESDRCLCRVCKCEKCGNFYCESTYISDEKAGDSFLAEVYRWFYQSAYNFKNEFTVSKSKFNEEFLKLFDDKDKPFVKEWLKRQKNQPFGEGQHNK